MNIVQYIREILHYDMAIFNQRLVSVAFFFFVCSIICFVANKHRWALVSLIIASAFLNYYAINLDPFLNSWDERFHCLVAKNMATAPFKPMLYVNPVLPYDYRNWWGNHIWVHKQPLFLWQMALFIKIFGATEVAARLSSCIMGVLLIIVVYRMAKIVANVYAGYIAALLCASNNFILEHVSGRQELDHNDMAFMFYVTLSIWAWLEYENSGKKPWLMLAGVFSGCSILVKWLTGLLVYAGFAFYHVVFKRDFLRYPVRSIFMLALVITAIVATPWQIYIIHCFPKEVAAAYQLNIQHFTQTLDGHGGSAWFYLQSLSQTFSGLHPLIFTGMILALVKNRNRGLVIALIFMVFIIYLFFSLATTKMISFVMPVLPLCFIFMSVTVVYLLKLFQGRKTVFYFVASLGLLFLFAQNLSIDSISWNHWRNPDTFWGRFAQNEADNTVIYKNLGKYVKPGYIIGYCNPSEEIDCMFYSGMTAYPALQESDLNRIIASGKKVAVFRNNLPDFVTRNPAVYIIPVEYRSNPSGL